MGAWSSFGSWVLTATRGGGWVSKRTHSRLDQQQRTEFFEEGRRLDADPATRDEAGCWLCRTRIDYTQPPGTTPDSHTLDHFYPVEDSPHLQNEPTNFRHAHFSCNSSRGKRGGTEHGLGEPMPAWW